MLLDQTQGFEDVCGMAMRGIDNDNIDMSLYQRIYTLQNVCCNTNSCTAQQTTMIVLGRQRVFDLFLNILDRDQTFEIEVLVNDRQLFFSCLGKDCLGLFQCDTFRSSDQILAGHAVLDLLCEILFEFQITVGNDTDKLSALSNRYTGDTEFCHQIVGIFQCIFRRQIEGVCDDTIL